MVDNPLTTNGVRAKLENLGAIRPSRRAVEVVAVPIGHVGPTTHWQMTTPDYLIKQAIIACGQLTGDESNQVFAQHCCGKVSV